MVNEVAAIIVESYGKGIIHGARDEAQFNLVK